jgi:curved DNA-binding protein
MEDYYKILELDESANPDQIKAAYRRLAKQHHPDLNKGNANSEALFKKINEANDTLADPQKRAQYDQQRKFGQGGPGANPFGQAHGFPGQEFHFNFGGQPFEEMFNQFFGGGHPFARQQPRNRDYQFNLNITLEDAFAGKSMPVSFDAHGKNTNITVNLPAGIEHGARMRYQGQGERNMPNAPPGDLYITIMINDHPVFQRHGQHLHTNMKVDAIGAMLGIQQDLQTIDGSVINVAVPAGTQHGATLRVQSYGMPVQHNSKHRGDLYIHVELATPTNLTQNQRDLLQEIQRQRSSL